MGMSPSIQQKWFVKRTLFFCFHLISGKNLVRPPAMNILATILCESFNSTQPNGFGVYARPATCVQDPGPVCWCAWPMFVWLCVRARARENPTQRMFHCRGQGI